MSGPSGDLLPVEIIERKGAGYPDTIRDQPPRSCDAPRRARTWTHGGGEHPEIAGAIKTMAVRQWDHAHFLVVCAFVDRYVNDLPAYHRAKDTVVDTVCWVAREHDLPATVIVNTPDDSSAMSPYLTVLGTSAESGDDGQSGRGNCVTGLIAPLRPMAIESRRGKNAVSHVGKLYNVAAGPIAECVPTYSLPPGQQHWPTRDHQACGFDWGAAPRHGDYRDACRAIVDDELGKLSTASTLPRENYA